MSGSPATALLQGLGRRKQARVKGKGWCGAQHLNSPGWCQLSSLSCPGVVPPAVSQFIPEERSRRSQAALWEGECHAWSSPPSGSPPGTARKQLESTAPLATVVLTASSGG